ncbi:MAG: reverse transcriptase domain-containing protein [Actinomycetota bacterium]
MRSAEQILGIIRERGRRGLPLERVYRHLFNPDLHLRAYARIARNDGATTPGATAETADGMSQAKIGSVIDALRAERYRWTPARRVHIAKTRGGTRPLGLPTWSDKLVQEVIRMILEAYYEPQFSPRSHGFRPGRGCHTALREIHRGWTGTTWFIEGDISSCFDSLDHEVLLSILAEKIHDGRFLRLVASLLKAGYLEDWRFGATLSGTPQGGVVSPMLSNIYLDRLDRFVTVTLIPAYSRGTRRKQNTAYRRAMLAANRLQREGKAEEARAFRKIMRTLPTQEPNDEGFRRLRYVRYADDFLLGFTGPRQEAEEIKARLREFLSTELHLELSEAKTLVTHGRTGAARFLGYEVSVMHNDRRHTHARLVRRDVNGKIGLRVPRDVVRSKCDPYMRDGKPIHRPERLNDSEFSIVAGYAVEYRGVVEYYRMAYNLREFGHLRWVMETSMAKTLAAKLKISVPRVYRRFGTVMATARGPRKVLRVTVDRGEEKRPLLAQWGAVPLVRGLDATLNDSPSRVWSHRSELLGRLLADVCELCGSQDQVQVHHVRHLADLERKRGLEKPQWIKVMVARHRRTLVVCRRCHQGIHGKD